MANLHFLGKKIQNEETPVIFYSHICSILSFFKMKRMKIYENMLYYYMYKWYVILYSTISIKIPSLKPFKNAPAPAFEASGSLRCSALAATNAPDTWEGFGEDSHGFFVKLTNGKPSFSREKNLERRNPFDFLFPYMFSSFVLQDETNENIWKYAVLLYV